MCLFLAKSIIFAGKMRRLFFILLVAVVALTAGAQDVPADITQQVISLLSEEFCTTLLRFNELAAKREQEAL